MSEKNTAVDDGNIIRVYDRVYVAPEELSALLRGYLAFYGARATVVFQMPDLQMNVVGLESPTANFSIVSAPEEHLSKFRGTGQTLLVKDINKALQRVEELGGARLQPRTPVPPGFQGRGQMPGGPVIEFVEWTTVTGHEIDLAELGLI
ncbi:hypothetical protein [Streptomyces sp. NPDC048411]|uniref:hypothetical protein n=1 Tax=Streptomyces sp. NPDC048411 TaxID=3157206 RepID=UPI0034516408